MKIKLSYLTIILITLIFFMIPHITIAQSGSITGKVIDELGLSLPGANVIIADLDNVGGSTNSNGIFRILNIPAGEHEIKISFIGYETITQKITVTDGQILSIPPIEMKPGAMVGEEIVILGDRLKGQAKALNKQMSNTNITNVVAADQIGRFPDANIGDAMKRIPGITMQYDQGEARFGIIRGTASKLNSVMINGERVPSAEASSRDVQLDLIPADMIQTIEVNKAVTPDMDADAIGGAVNLITRSAPNGYRVSGTLASGYNMFSNKAIWTGGLVLANRFIDNKLGVVLSGSYNSNHLGADNIEAEWDEGDNMAFIAEHDIRQYYVQRIRQSASISLDYTINPKNKIFLKAMYNHRNDFENRYRRRFRRINEPELINGQFISEAGLRRQTKGGVNNEMNKNQRLEDQRTRNLSLSGEHFFGNVKFTWSGIWAKASEDRPNERYIRYELGDLFDPVTNNEKKFLVISDLSNPERPNIIPLTSSDVSNGNFEFGELYEERRFTTEENFNTRFDFEIPLSEGKNKSVLKFGGRLRNKSKQRTNSYDEYKPTDSNPINFDDFGGSVPINDQSDTDYLAGAQYQAGQFATREFLGNLDLYNASLFEKESVLKEFIPGNFNATETITGGYAMLKKNIGTKLFLIFGARIENTKVDYNGFEIDEETAETLDDIKSISDSRSYTNFMPGIHLKYDISENTILRFAWSNTLARPSYPNLVPFRRINSDDNELEEGNPDLAPTTSMNFDLTIENYFESIGLVSGGIFYKDINDFIFSYTQTNYLDPISNNTFDEYSTSLNGSNANLIGLEIAFQRQLDFLPGLLKGLGLYINYTYTHTNAKGIPGRENEEFELPGTADNVFNVSLFFETKKLVLRASLNYTSDYLDETGKSAFFDRYYDKQTFLDLNASYAFTNKFRIFFEANNLTDQPLRYYQGTKERTTQLEFYNSRFNFGLKFDMFAKQ